MEGAATGGLHLYFIPVNRTNLASYAFCVHFRVVPILQIAVMEGVHMASSSPAYRGRMQLKAL
jgi:hypothetical protein